MPLQQASISEFIEAATLRGAALESGNSKVANAQLNRLARIHRTLNLRGRKGREAMLRLLHHDVGWVQVAPATFTLDVAEHDTLSVLGDLSGSGEIVGLTAKLLLDWSEKQLRQTGAKAEGCSPRLLVPKGLRGVSGLVIRWGVPKP